MATDAANTLANILIARVRQMSVESARSAREAVSERLVLLQAELEQTRGAAQAVADGGRPEGTAAIGRTIELQQDRYARLLDQYERLLSAETARANTVTVIEPATVPLAPSRPRTPLNVAIALAMGLVGGTGLAFLFDNLDTKLYTTRRIVQVVGLPILGTVPEATERGRNGLFHSDSPEREALRRLRMHILALDGGAPRALLVTSAEPGEGKSTIVANLASTLAEAGSRVVVVDADLRRPTLHSLLALPNQLGLTSILDEKATWDQVIRDTRLRNVWAITSGPSTSNPAELLASPRMSELVEHMARRFDVVLLDTSCLLAVADAAVLARSVAGVVLVAKRGQAREQTIQAATAELTDVRANVIGLVVNRSEPDESYRYYQSSTQERPSAERSSSPQLETHGGHHGDSRGQHALP
ncbi:MAG: polysaccharide biosynthesis tyrosine autokinase [Chloroflexota bacterium]|nr:polysaccharide biosynthesis tyrosine autokinase [Chloroflexota bacterium]